MTDFSSALNEAPSAPYSATCKQRGASLEVLNTHDKCQCRQRAGQNGLKYPERPQEVISFRTEDKCVVIPSS